MSRAEPLPDPEAAIDAQLDLDEACRDRSAATSIAQRGLTE